MNGIHYYVYRKMRKYSLTLSIKHKTLKVTPAQEAGLSEDVKSLEWVVGLIDARAPKGKKRGPYKKNNSK